ncbi:NAD(P)/FAD-dependent oxidoreductase [Amycolatopsis pithecellobii]|uniref:NAD(P)/FAD-dependent oxidoreductase n=1 Tax=Amycolatopsis pithecellobii TaxID=664692 RepID=A0A6N7Z8A6_9PSEU|nr:NAD(P)/FAD-dependent oxidoreductase [Amycolatopsis pithecellobii]MTD57841.1 NAD(P)/FAD-dependent oxidoreductase [Amycolatopsis pithecellobii]
MTTAESTRIVIVGGGTIGAGAARELRKRLPAGEAELTVIDRRSYLTYQPFLAEAAAGSVEPRHVVVPLREILPGCRVLTAEVTGIDRDARSVTMRAGDHVEEIGYDVLIVGAGSVSRTLPIPGLAEHGIGFKTLEEAIYLRNHALSRLDRATTTMDPQTRRRLLTFVFVGGGYAGVEAMAELEDMVRQALPSYEIDPGELRWVLVEAMDRIMPEVSPRLANYTVDVLRGRGFEVRLGTQLKSAQDCHVVLSDGAEFDAGTLVWTAGVKANPMLAHTDLPLDERGRVKTSATLEVPGSPGVFAAGDCAAVPDLTKKDPSATCPPSAQHASRQAKRVARNVIASLHGRPLRPYRHVNAGSVASIGLHKGVAEVYRVKVRGFPAWAMHRLYHLALMPTAHRKARIAADWLLSLPFRRQVVATGEQQNPRREFVAASRS